MISERLPNASSVFMIPEQYQKPHNPILEFNLFQETETTPAEKVIENSFVTSS